MAKIREEIAGKRFLCVSKSSKLKLSKIAEWDWRSGVIRACTHSDSKHPDLQVLVEYDDVSWQRREWVHVYREEAFQLLLIEHTLFWTGAKSGTKIKAGSGVAAFLWPVLVFEPLIDEVGLFGAKERPVEHLVDRSLEFQDYSLLQAYQEEIPANCESESEEYVRQWVADQDGQRILCTTPSVLVGFRVQVYRSEGTTQWYTAVIVGYNDATRELTVTDDTVLEEHSEDPSLVHIRLLGEGVVESILRGENVGITPRRSRSSTNNHHHNYHHYHQTGVRHIRRDPFPSRGRKSSLSKSSNPSSSPNQVLSPPSPTRPISPTSPVLAVKLICAGLSPESEGTECISPENNSGDEASSVSVGASSYNHGSVTPSKPPLVNKESGGSSKSKVESTFISLSEKEKRISPPPPSTPPKCVKPGIPDSDKPDEATNSIRHPKPNPQPKNSSCPSKDPTCASHLSGDQHLHFSDQNSNSATTSSTDSVKGAASERASKTGVKNKAPSPVPAKTSHIQESPTKELSNSKNKSPHSGLVLLGKTDKRTFLAKHNFNFVSNIKPVISLVKCDSVKSDLFVQAKGQVEDSPKCSKSNDSLITASKEPHSEQEVAQKKSPGQPDHVEKGVSPSQQVLPEEQDKDTPKSDATALNAEAAPICHVESPIAEDCVNESEASPSPPVLGQDLKKSHVLPPEAAKSYDAVKSAEKKSPKSSKPHHDASPRKDSEETVCKASLTNLNNGVVRSPHPRLSNWHALKQGVPDLIKVNEGRLLNDTRSNPTLILLDDPPEGKSKEDPTSHQSKASDTSAITNSSVVSRSSLSHTSVFSLYPSSAPSSEGKDNESQCNITHQQSNSWKTTPISSLADAPVSLNKIGASTLGDSSGHISDVISGNSELSCKPLGDSTVFTSLAVSTSSYNKIETTPDLDASNSPSNSVTIFSVSPVTDSSKVKVSSSSVTPVLSTRPLDGKVATSFCSGNNNGNNSNFAGLAQSLAVAGAVGGRAVTITATSGPAPQGSSRVASPPSVSITAVVRSPGSQHSQDLPTIQGQDGSQTSQLQLHPQHTLTVQQCSSSTSALASTRMDQCDGSSDSGVSVTERSVSRSSVLSDDRSSSAEVKPNTPTPAPILAPNHSKISQQHLALDRKESVKVWRNPVVVSHSDYSVRHIHSLQHSMSQHFPGVPPHVPPSVGAQGVPHHPHGPPPPSVSLSHGLPPGLPYHPTHPPPHPLHLPLQQLSAAALYPQLQLPVPPLQPAAFGLLPRHQEDFNYLEQQQQQSDRIQRERREAEVREKAKMDRERQRKERERREREVRRDHGEKEIQLVDQHFAESFRIANQRFGREKPQHNLHMTSDTRSASAYYAHQGLASSHQASPTTTVPLSQSLIISQQHQPNAVYQAHSQKSTHWSQAGGLPVKVDARDHRPVSLSQSHSQHSEGLRKVKEPDLLVRDSIFKAFRADDSLPESHIKTQIPPPAHTKHLVDKSISSMANYPQYLSKELKHQQERNAYAMLQEKTSVIVKPELQYDKVPPHSISPKQRIAERSSPYSSNSNAGPNPYKPYEPSPSPHRGSTPHPPVSHPSSPISVELTKARPPQSSPLSAQSAHIERYYTSVTKTPITHAYQSNLVTGNIPPNHLHANALSSKSKVSSPPTQLYGKPGIASGTPVCKVETRPSQPLPLSSKVAASLTGGPPPPAHCGNRNTESRPPPNPHEQRLSHNRSPFDARMYNNSGACNPKQTGTNLPPHPAPRGTPPIPPNASAPSNHPTQTQPLDLGTRDDGASPNRRRSQTPTPQEAKKPRLDSTANSQPLLSRVSEPSPLYPSAATTITTVENTAALSKLKRGSSPVQNIGSSNLQHCNPHITTTNGCIISNSNASSSITSTSNEATSTTTANSKQTLQHPPPSTTPTSQREESNSPTAPASTKMSEPEKSSSPGPGSSGYVHKLKKAWLQRHESGAETPVSSPSSLPTRSVTPPPPPPPTVVSSTTSTKTTQNPVISAGKQDLKNAPRKPVKTLSTLPNGHVEDSKEVDSTSTDSDDSSSTSLKAKRTKIKRNVKRTKRSSESNSDSDKESDGSEGSLKKQERVQKPDAKGLKKRGRKPKIKAEKDKEDGSKIKKAKDDPPPIDPLHKPPISHLKKTGESFLQDRACYEVAPKLPKCRECRWTPHQRNKKMPNIFCRFYAFRRLRYTKNGQLAVAGFSDPVKDAFGEDLRLWIPDPSSPAPDLDKEMSIFLLTHVGDQFCDLVQQENDAMALHIGEERTVAWKRVVQGVREMCDVCETTLFNIHWACSKCGFVVCIDCYKGRKEGTIKVWDVEDGAKERDEYSWLLCASRLSHEQDKLMLTQIIAGNALKELGKMIHEVRYKWGIPMYCTCPEANRYKEKEQEDKKLNGLNKDLLKSIKKETKSCDLVNGSFKLEKGDGLNNGKDEDMSNSPLTFFAEVALSNDKRESESSNSDSDSDSDEKGQSSTLRELLVRQSAKSGSSAKEEGTTQGKCKEPSKKKVKHDTLDDVISCVIDRGVEKDNKKDPMKVELKHFIRKYNYNRNGREPLPIRIMTKTESRLLYPNVPHSWLCDGKLLRLNECLHKENIKVYQDQWKRGQPVIVSGTGQNLSGDLWKPSSFSRDFGDIKNNLINCLTDNIVPNQPMKKFWEGFENYSKRLKDEKGHPMVLKLKDWPPGDDFAEVLPKRFEDLMKVLPMGEYTRRNGSLNLAGRLPECFVRPDLGPKMYIAYGSASYPHKASTNLHLDISDAVNVMCYVGIPKDMSTEDSIRESLKAIDDAGCDVLTRQRVREKDELPGALWHIYHARDADKIRDLINKVAIERGKKLEPYHDPIHDQSWYLDRMLRERLYVEYGVEGYAIVQCMGDAVFVPAGAPHQVRNLLNCIKVAEDFVSPENVAHCFHMTQEFRHLSDTHTNHEDKLQIKNIIYHAMKDSITYLLAAEQNGDEVKREKES